MNKPWFCTMKTNTDIVKAPKKNGSSGYKWPSLEEALQFYCKRSVGEFAHDAMYDVKACRDIFFAMEKKPDFETACFIDYETTGFVIGGAVVTEGQGRACQVAMLLCDKAGRSIAEISTLIKPDGWKIGTEAGKIHGFTDEQCEKYGMSYRSACGLYQHMAQRADFFVAHNADFDSQIMAVEMAYYNRPVAQAAA